MKLNYFSKQLSTVGRWMVTTLFCVSAIAFIWQGALFSNTVAFASPAPTLIAADAGDRVKDKTRNDAARSKNFIRDSANKVEDAAKSNAKKVERATGGDGNVLERKAKRDAARIQKRAEEDAARTQKAVDNNTGAVRSAIDKIKDAFGK